MLNRLVIGIIILVGLLTAVILYEIPMEKDKFGITKIYPTRSLGREWYSNWGNGEARTILSGETDEFDSQMRASGDGTWTTTGNGILHVEGEAPRFNIVGDKWLNVEMTWKIKIISRFPTTNSQLTGLEVRYGNYGDYPDACEAGYSYGNPIRTNGDLFWIKEVQDHKLYSDRRGQVQTWTSLPYNKTIGIKSIVQNFDNNKFVHLETWLDVNDNNNWKKITTVEDKGGWVGLIASEFPDVVLCQERQNDIILNFPTNSVRFRLDFVKADVSAASVREINPIMSTFYNNSNH